MILRRLFFLILLLLSGSTAIAQPPTPEVAPATLQFQSGRNLFFPVDEAQTRRLPSRPDLIGTERTGFVALNQDALALASASRHVGRVVDDPGIALNLFDDVVYTAVNTAIEPRPLNQPGYIWYGSIPAVAFSSVVMVVGDRGIVDIRVLIPGKNYYVDPAGDGIYRVSQINTYQQRGDLNGYQDFILFTPDQAQSAASTRAENGCINPPDTACLVDVMVVYTPSAAAFLGGEANIEIAIENTVALTNLTYMNSNVDFRLRLVHTEQVVFDENPGYNLDVLANPTDGIIDEVHTLRDQYQADLVALIPGTPASERLYCGIAYLPTVIDEASLPSESGFSVTEVLCISDITFAHEIGHNMGKAHDRPNAGGAVHAYAYGYQDIAQPAGADWGDFVTVMAYSTGGECPAVYQPGVCPAIAWWSNPDQTYNAKPLGTADENNALSLNQTARLIAQYRISDDGGQSTPTPPPATPDPNITPTITPTASETPPPPIELVLNGGFEIDADDDKIPDGWSANVEKVLKCNTPEKPDTAFEGECAVRLKSGAKVQQKFVDVGMIGANTAMTISAQISGKNVVAEMQAVVVLKYVDPSLGINGKLKQTLVAENGDYAYTPVTATTSVEGAVQKGKLMLRYTGVSGKVMVDSVSVVSVQSNAVLLPLP